MGALVVFESTDGACRAIAEAVGVGLAAHTTVQVVAVDEAPTGLSADIDLLVVGGSHDRFDMTAEASPREALAREAAPTHATGRGLLRWLAALDARHSSAAAAVYDIRPASPAVLNRIDHAAGAIERTLRRTGVRRLLPAEHFSVTVAGPLADGEVDRARAWGGTLGVTLRRGVRT